MNVDRVTREHEGGPGPTSQSAAAMVGTTVGNYVITRHLASGGMADVYVAEHPQLGREVAVKLLNTELAADVEVQQRFLQEAQVTATLRHPGVVEIFDLGVTQGRPYYAMELLDGQDLASYLQTHGPLPVDVAHGFLTQLADALSVAHQRGVVHRDLKPLNVFAVSGSPVRLKLMDFGIAKVCDVRRGPGATLHGQVLGTPTHMAPEQALGQQDQICEATDIYALGVIAYELLVGKQPFQAETDFLLMSMHVRDPVPSIREAAPHVPTAFCDLVYRCLQKNPASRPRCASQLSSQLAALELRRSGAVAVAPGQPRQPDRPAADVRGEEPPAQQTTAARAKPPKVDPGSPAPTTLQEDRSDALMSELTDDPRPAGGVVTLSHSESQALDRVLRRMQTRADFPSFLSNVSEISIKADADLDYSAWQLSEAILKDFALTAKLLRMSNVMYPGRFGGKVHSVSHAVVILGFDSVRSMALGVSVFRTPGQTRKERAVKGAHHEELAQSAINSLIAGEIARALAEAAGVEDPELAMMCGIFRNLGLQLTMEYLPAEYARMREMMKSEQVSLATASRRVLGTSLQKLGVGIAERWCLPETLRCAMSTEPDSASKLERQEERLSSLSKLANDFCNVVAEGRRENWDAKLQRLLVRHENLLHLEAKEIGGLLGRVCKSFEERYASIFGPYSRHSRFLTNARTITGESAPKVRNAPPPMSDLERAALEQHTEELADGLQKRVAVEPLLQAAVKQLAAALCARRCVLLCVTPDRQSLVARFAVGPDSEVILKQLQLPLARASDVFSSAYRSARSVVVGDALAPRVTRRMPQSYYEVLGSTAVGVYPCASRGYRTALLLIDDDAEDLLPAEERVMATKKMRELVARAAERLS